MPYPNDICRLISAGTTDLVEIAAHTYISRRDRQSHPDGSFDKAKRWYPNDDEERPCCGFIRHPSRGFPFSLMVHCRTLQHICRVVEVDETAVRKVLAKIDPQRLAAAKAREAKRIALASLVQVRLAKIPDTSIADLLMAAVTPVKSHVMLRMWSDPASMNLLRLCHTLLERLPEKTDADRIIHSRISVYLRLITAPIPMKRAA